MVHGGTHRLNIYILIYHPVGDPCSGVSDISFYFEGPAGCSLHHAACLDHVALTSGVQERLGTERTAQRGAAMTRLLTEQV